MMAWNEWERVKAEAAQRQSAQMQLNQAAEFLELQAVRLIWW
ncbi:hypothetical protein [Streptomyces sp. NPDC056255]